jgi:hypothetical protein
MLGVTVFLLAGPCALAQNITSTLVGQVADTSGAVIADAQVTASNMQTGVSFHATTDSSGTYSVPDLLAGLYQVTVSKQGFATLTTTDVRVLTFQTVRVDVTLKMGPIQQHVEVVGSAPLVHTDSQSVGSALASEQISELPLMSQGIGALIGLVAGSVGTNSFPTTSGGTDWGSHDFTVNGMQVNDPGNATGVYTYASDVSAFLNMPPLDSMQEFRIDSVDMNAEYRQVASVTMVTKQGSNKFHGTAYDFLQNTVLNANSFTNNYSGIKRPNSLFNQFGASLGGPIKQNKAWFYFNYGGLRQRSYATPVLTFPSAAMRQGDFSGLCTTFTGGGCTTGTQLYNPLTGQPFANNSIPSSMFASQVTPLLAYLPVPNQTTNPLGLPNGVPNYIGTVRLPGDANNYMARVDYQLSNSDSVFVVFTRDIVRPWAVALGGPSTYDNAENFGGWGSTITPTWIHTFNPTTINDLRGSIFEQNIRRSSMNCTFNPATLFPQLVPGINRGIPSMSTSGYSSMKDYGCNSGGTVYDIELAENLTHVRGRHTIKAGVGETGYKVYRMLGLGGLGAFGMTGQWTGNKGWPGQPHSQGNSFADFLLGDVNSFSYALPGHDEIGYSRDWDFYAKDTWQVTSRLTLNYGLRYTYQTPWSVRDNMQAFFDFNTGKLILPETSTTAVQPPNTYQAWFAAFPFETTAALGIPLRYFIPQTKNFAPRFGFAYRPRFLENTVVRGGYGIYYNFNGWYAGNYEGTINLPFGTWQAQNNGSISYASSLPGNPTSPYLPDLTFANPIPTTGSGGAVVNSHPIAYAPSRDNPVGQVQQWSLTLERQFKSDWMARMSYVGSTTNHLPFNESNINVPLTQTPNAPIQNQVPWQPWSQVLASRSGGMQHYESLQLEAIKRFAHGSSFQAEYLWDHSLDNVEIRAGNPQRWQFPGLDYGNTTYVQRQNLVFNYIYDLPFGQGKHWLSHLPKLADHLLGGWQVAGITQYSTGVPLSVTFSVPSSVVGWWGGRADRVAGVPLYAGQQRGTHDVETGVQWFNPAAFAPPQEWTWGDSSRNSVFGPGQGNWDLSAHKNFSLTERLRMQFRADFFDAFNHFNLGSPYGGIADTRDGGLPVATSGKIYDGWDSRVIQLGLKFVF